MVNKLRRSCDACYKRKIRCDASQSGGLCDWCDNHGLICSFSKRVPRAKSKPGRKPEALAKSPDTHADHSTTASPISQISTPESLVQAQPARPKPPNSWCNTCRVPSKAQPSRRLSRNSSLDQILYSGNNFGIVCPQTGFPHFTQQCEEWVHSRTGQWPRFEYNSDFVRTSSSSSLLSSSKIQLPKRWVVQLLFEEYSNSDLILVFPVVDIVLFKDTIALAYSTNHHAQRDQLAAKACVYAFLAIAGNHCPSSKATAFFDCNACAKAAQYLLLECTKVVDIIILQTILMLFLFECSSSIESALLMYHALACRTVLALGGHVVPLPAKRDTAFTNEEREDRQLRMLFWLCYYFDKNICFRTCQPPMIDDDFCDLTLPDEYLPSLFKGRGRDPTDDSQMPYLPGDLRLCLLKSKVLHKLYSKGSLQKSDAELLRTIRELDDELESWRQSIPAEFAPALSVRKDVKLADHLTLAKSMLHIELHLEYHHTLHVIHCASGRNAPVVGNEYQISSGVQSSLDISVEASRSTIVYLNAAASRLAADAFWSFVFYPMSALLTLFFNILRNPENEYSNHDLELLITSSKIVHDMPKNKITSFTIAYLRQADALVAELVRLAQAAIAKSRQELRN